MAGLTKVAPVTLQNVEGWGTSMHILRDPPKSIMTRKIDKVGDSNDILDQIDDAGPRANDAILYYPRGVNPSVAVSYSNTNNAQVQGGAQAYLPYRIMDGGAFRPPVLTQQQLQPLSRQSRLTAHVTTNMEAVDYSKERVQLQKPEYYKEIDNKIKTSAKAGFQGMDITTRHVQEPSSGIEQYPLDVSAPMRPGGGMTRDSNVNNMDTQRYLNELTTTNMSINKGMDSNIPMTRDLDPRFSTKKQTTIEYYTPISQTRIRYDAVEHNLERNLPTHFATTNVGRDIHTHMIDSKIADLERTLPLTSATSARTRTGETNIGSRQAVLRPTIDAGGFAGKAVQPTMDRPEVAPRMDSRRMKMARSVQGQVFNRR